jgi:RHS repeat-associated protein
MQTNYLIDPNGILTRVLAEVDTSNNLISFYVYDGAGLVAKINSSNEYYFYHYDGLGSTIAITDNNAQVVNSYAYSPEGLVGTQETIPNPFTYVGRFGVMAEGNGLYFMRARYYDPEVGRFINKDPIGYEGGMNLFAYAGNNPVNLRDPYGLTWVYQQSTGDWNHVNDQTGVITYAGTGYAGVGAGYNNPAMQNTDSVGPLPQGGYTIGPQQNNVTNSGTQLPASIELTPDPENNMFERPGRWFFHGRNAAHPNTSSEGCPVGERTLRNQVGNSGDNRLLVIP